MHVLHSNTIAGHANIKKLSKSYHTLNAIVGHTNRELGGTLSTHELLLLYSLWSIKLATFFSVTGGFFSALHCKRDLI